MTKIKEYVIGALVGAVIVLVLGAFFGGSSGSALFGAVKPGIVEFQTWGFTQGLTAGKTSQFIVDNTGAVSSTASAKFSAVTINGGSAIQGEAKSAAVWYPQATLTLGPYTAATSTTSTIFTFPFGTANGFAVGDGCITYFNQTPSTTSFGADATLWAVATTTATGTVTFWNGANANVTLQSTTPYLSNTSSTFTIRCVH